MNLITIVAIAVGLSMDALAVSISSGAAIQQMHIRHALRIGFYFGFFQGLMPLLGWTLGGLAAEFVDTAGHWIAFTLLLIIGLKMIWEARKIRPECDDDEMKDPLNFWVLIMLSVATSIDALAVGVSLSLLHNPILMPILVIGGITCIISFGGTYLGMYVCDRGSEKFTARVEILGGLILIGIGLNILLGHSH